MEKVTLKKSQHIGHGQLYPMQKAQEAADLDSETNYHNHLQLSKKRFHGRILKEQAFSVATS